MPAMVKTLPPRRAPGVPTLDTLGAPLKEPRNLRSRFIPLAEDRMTAVLEAMDYLEQLSQRNRYHYTDEEWAVMRKTLQNKLEKLDASFKRGKGSRPVFRFEEDDG